MLSGCNISLNDCISPDSSKSKGRKSLLISQSSDSSKNKGRKSLLSGCNVDLNDCNKETAKFDLQPSRHRSGDSSSSKINTWNDDKENSFTSPPNVIASTPQGKDKFKPLFRRFHRNPRQTFEE